MELGDIVPPKTSEETIAELISVVSELRNEIREMKTVQHKGDSNESIICVLMVSILMRT